MVERMLKEGKTGDKNTEKKGTEATERKWKVCCCTFRKNQKAYTCEREKDRGKEQSKIKEENTRNRKKEIGLLVCLMQEIKGQGTSEGKRVI